MSRMGESKHTPLSDAEVAEAYEEEMRGPQGVSFALRDDHLLARAHRTLMLEALRKWDDFGLKMWGREFTPETVKEFSELWSATSGAIKAATGGEP